MIAVILPAGGAGTRMKSSTPKALVKLRGKPLLIRSLEAFQGIRGIREIVLALPPRSIRGVLRKYGKALQRLGVTKIAPGGETRQESVQNALSVVESDIRWVVVHDAARPLVTKEEIRAVLRVARRFGAAITAIPAKDTIKEVESGGRITRTLDRSKLWLALTPQAFRADWLRQAHSRAWGKPATDDAQLLERIGKKIRVVSGSSRNFKITTKEDLKLAEALLGRRK